MNGRETKADDEPQQGSRAVSDKQRKSKQSLLDALKKDVISQKKSSDRQGMPQRVEAKLPIETEVLSKADEAVRRDIATSSAALLISDLAHVLLRVRSQLTQCHTFVAHQYTNSGVLPEFVQTCLRDVSGATTMWLLENLGKRIDATFFDSERFSNAEHSTSVSKHTIAKVMILVPAADALSSQQSALEGIWDAVVLPVLTHYKKLQGAHQQIHTKLRDVAGEIAPNLSALCGDEVAGLLIGLSSGIVSLAKLTPSDVLKIGSDFIDYEKPANSSSRQFTVFDRVAWVREVPDLKDQSTLKKNLASKVLLAARYDSFSSTDPGRSLGEGLRQQILEKFHKRSTREETEDAALPRPEARATTKRGGWKARLRRKRAQETAQATAETTVGVSETMDWYE